VFHEDRSEAAQVALLLYDLTSTSVRSARPGWREFGYSATIVVQVVIALIATPTVFPSSSSRKYLRQASRQARIAEVNSRRLHH
jgi:hypothetical protein